jgi:cytoskeletal protein CcmA (bactofilin family)
MNTPADNAAKTEDTNATPAANRMDIPGGAFQRPGQPAGRVPGAYPGAYASYNPQAQNTSADQQSGRRLVIGQGITLSGEIESCEYLVVEGTVEAALKGASTLEIAETGSFFGTVEINEATVAGRFEGDLTVKGRLTIKATGSITGSIAYKELAVEAGAVLDGKVNPLDGSKVAASGNRKLSDGSFNKAKKSNAAEQGNELPFADRAAANG